MLCDDEYDDDSLLFIARIHFMWQTSSHVKSCALQHVESDASNRHFCVVFMPYGKLKKESLMNNQRHLYGAVKKFNRKEIFVNPPWLPLFWNHTCTASGSDVRRL